jgi:dCMP deaminase
MADKILVAYVPALHQGYINFFKKNFGTLYLLSTELVREVPRMERDIRAISPEEMQKAISALSIFSEVKILTKKNVGLLKKAKVVMPDEDVSRHFAETYLKEGKVDYVSTFLRWDWQNSQKKSAPQAVDRVISRDAFHKEIMKKAFMEANKSSDWWRQIGAILIKDEKVLFTGFNHPLPSDQTHNIFGDPRSNFDSGVSYDLSKFVHAEAGLIALAAKHGTALEGASIFVTTFPCPVCAKSVVVAGIKKVYYTEGYSLLDAEDILKGAGVEIIKVEMEGKS